MTHGPKAVQQAVYTLLNSDATLGALIEGVFDFVPQDTDFPFVVIGDDDWLDRGSHTTDGLEGILTIHSWTQSRGRKQVHDIMAEVDRLMHDVTLTVSGWSSLVLRRETSNILQDPDSVTFHGVQRFRILLTRE